MSGKEPQPWRVHRSAPQNPWDVTAVSGCAPAVGEELLTSDFASWRERDAVGDVPGRRCLAATQTSRAPVPGAKLVSLGRTAICC